VRPNRDRPRCEHGGDNRVPPESWQKTLHSENKSMSTLLTEGLAPSMSSMHRASASVLRSAGRPVEVVSPSSGIRGVASSWRWSVPRRSVMKSRLPKRKSWKGAKMGDSHSLMHEAMGNSNKPK
jgi:hypothetical protein